MSARTYLEILIIKSKAMLQEEFIHTNTPFDDKYHPEEDITELSRPHKHSFYCSLICGANQCVTLGSFDIAYLANIPKMVLMAAADENELRRMIITAAAINDRPSAFRYPRGASIGLKLDSEVKPLTIGKGRIIKNGEKIDNKKLINTIVPPR